jgi:hypothetical protein
MQKSITGQVSQFVPCTERTDMYTAHMSSSHTIRLNKLMGTARLFCKM